MSAVPVPITTTEDPLAEAVRLLVDAKRDEEIAHRRRVAAEERVLALHPAKEEGSETFEAGGCRVTLTGKLSYACDNPQTLAETLVGMGWAPNMIPIRTRVELDATGCKYLRHNEPQAWATIARFITVTPTKTSISIKV